MTFRSRRGKGLPAQTVSEALAQLLSGVPIRRIARELHIDRKTLRRLQRRMGLLSGQVFHCRQGHRITVWPCRTCEVEHARQADRRVGT